MSDEHPSLPAEYAQALEDYLQTGQQRGLVRAQELGREAVRAGLGVLEMAELHARALHSLLTTAFSVTPGLTERALEFQLQALATLEIATLGLQEESEQLRDVRTITEPSLGRLGIEDLLGQLLERARAAVQADTAAVLLLDEAAGQLVARAARGLEEEVRQGARVPLGAGFAGRIAQSKQPVVLDRVDSSTVVNPILWGKGIRSMLGVPLLVNERVIGVLHVGSLGEHRFGREDVEVLEITGERIAGAISASRLALEQAAATVLEHSLGPSALPTCPGISLAARYVPAERDVGGDWYDAFVLPSGKLWAVTGDVGGHGLAAAVMMGHVRSVLRSYAFLGHDPEEVLRLTDLKLQYFDPGTMVTALCAASAPPFETVRLSIAGHPPPVLAVPGMATRLVELSPDLPINARPGVRRSAVTVTLPPGGVLLFYTDGLIERRDQLLEERLEQLRSVVTAESPEIVCQRVMGDLVGVAEPTDDIALIALRREPVATEPTQAGQESPR
ncbi:MAG: SpoIIE family protein phosphatase [Acidimicrobiales bacterium]|nr:SpoIIE family protein phosphatase [Acidimicrobiales bacterium]